MLAYRAKRKRTIGKVTARAVNFVKPGRIYSSLPHSAITVVHDFSTARLQKEVFNCGLGLST